MQTTSGSPIELPVGFGPISKRAQRRRAASGQPPARPEHRALSARPAAHGPANRKLASVRADLEETETVTQAREQHAPRRATCDFEAAIR